MNNINKTNQWIRHYCLTLKSIFDLHGTKYSLFKGALNQYWQLMNSRISSRGPKDTVSFLKAIKSLSVKLALGIQFDPLPFTKSDKSGFPKCLDKVKPFLTGDASDKRIGLTILQLYTSLTLDADTKVDSITTISKGLGLLGTKWSRFLKNSFSKKFRPQSLDWDRYHRSSNKQGPNGPSTLTAMIDLISVRNDKRVWPNLLNYLNKTKNDLFHEFQYILEHTLPKELPKLPTARLALLPEGGGKTRVIAIGDYATQLSLTPLFRDTMRMLKSIPQDGTYDQQNGIKLIIHAMSAKKPIYCYDLSSATDRFPRKLQEQVLESIYLNGIGEAWGRLLTDRSFSHMGKDIEYAVGQPMGFLSSWSTFALTHHAFIQYCASREGISNFSDYVVLGDDVAIFCKKVALRYASQMKWIGVEINLNKSLIWEPGTRTYPYAEFAKRIIWNGIDVSPIPFDVIKTYMRNPVKEFFSLWFSLRSFGIDIKGQPVNNLSSILGPKDRSKILILASAPETLLGKLKRETPTALYGGTLEGPWKDLDVNLIPAAMMETLYTEYLTKILEVDKLVRSLHHYNEIANEVSQHQGRALVKKSTLDILSQITLSNVQPLPMVIHTKRAELVRIILRDNTVSAEPGWEFQQVKSLWEDVFHCTDDIFGNIKTKNSRLSEIQSSIVLQIHQKLTRGFVPIIAETVEVLKAEEKSYEQLKREYEIARTFLKS